MAVAFILDFPDATLDQYDQVIEKMGLTDGASPPSAQHHWVAKTDDGIRVVDVWDSDEAFEKFSQEQIGPITQEVGIAEPTVTRYEVHNTIQPA
jgi:hypothetical protein